MERNNYEYIKNTFKLKHRIIVEEHIGRKLLPTEHIHHINGKKNDNRIENLQILTHKEHMILHNQKYEIEKKCIVCQKKYIPNPTKRKRSKVCSNDCKIKLDKINASKRKKVILQYDLENNFIKKWESSRDIQNILGYHESNICKCCKEKIKKAYGFIWKYEK